jgi:hypothetical protein
MAEQSEGESLSARRLKVQEETMESALPAGMSGPAARSQGSTQSACQVLRLP